MLELAPGTFIKKLNMTRATVSENVFTASPRVRLPPRSLSQQVFRQMLDGSISENQAQLQATGNKMEEHFVLSSGSGPGLT